MTPTEDLKHDIKVLVELVEELLLEHSYTDKENRALHAYQNLRHKYSQELVME